MHRKLCLALPTSHYTYYIEDNYVTNIISNISKNIINSYLRILFTEIIPHEKSIIRYMRIFHFKIRLMQSGHLNYITMFSYFPKSKQQQYDCFFNFQHFFLNRLYQVIYITIRPIPRRDNSRLNIIIPYKRSREIDVQSRLKLQKYYKERTPEKDGGRKKVIKICNFRPLYQTITFRVKAFILKWIVQYYQDLMGSLCIY